MLVKELKFLAREYKIPGRSKMKKKELEMAIHQFLKKEQKELREINQEMKDMLNSPHQNKCKLPFDLNYEGNFISRPDGVLSKNEKLNRVFKKRRFTMLFAHPYELPDCLKLFDVNGNELDYILK